MTKDLKLGNDLTRVTWDSKTVRGRNTNHLLANCRALYDMSYRQLGDLFNVSHETIRQRLQTFSEQYPDEWLVIESKKRYYDHYRDLYAKFDGDLAQIADELDVTLNKARMMLNDLIPKEDRIKQISIERRQKSLCHSVFSFKYVPGVNFEGQLTLWLTEQSKDVSERLYSYYINALDAPKDARFERFKDLRILEAWLKENVKIDDLIDKEVLWKNRKL
jgi:hypothetical protein